MTADQTTRKLAAILAADIVGYSRLMGQNEAGTLSLLKEARASLIEPAVHVHKGRIFKLMGDGMLVEFASAVDAVQAALTIQREIADQVSEHPNGENLQFRIGVHLGDVIVDDDDIYGEGVNIASRLEALAPTGGISMSEDVYRQVRGKVDAEFDDLGPQHLKNISEPVRVYSVQLDIATGPSSHAQDLEQPSIAILPFENLSGGADDQLISDGIVEDVITELSRFRWLMVIARNSTFAYRGSTKDMRQVGRELGVRYIVEGAIRRLGNRLRLTAQLIDAKTGAHIWAEKFDRDADDIFALQDELTSSIVGRVAPSLRSEEIRKAEVSRLPDFHAWQHFVRGLSHFYRFQRTENEAAILEFEHALETDQAFQVARALLSKALFTKLWLGWSEAPDSDIQRSTAEARLAVQEAPELAEGHYALACIEFWSGDLERALRAIDRSLELNPNFADAYLVRSQILACLGCFHEAEPAARRALLLNPVDPLRWVYFGNLADALYGQERWQEAFQAAQSSCDVAPEYTWGILMCAASLSRLQRDEEALLHLKKIEDQNPLQLLADYPFQHDADRERVASAIRRISDDLV